MTLGRTFVPQSVRRRGQRASLTVGLAVLLLAVAACSTGPGATPTIPPDATGSIQPATTGTPMPSPSAAFPVSLTDDEGTKVELPAEPTKIVSLTPAATETLFALGVGDRIVGKVEDFSLFPPEAAAIPDVAKFGEVDVEKIVGLEADLVIAGGNNFNPPDAIAQLRAARRPGRRPLRAGHRDRASPTSSSSAPRSGAPTRPRT